MKVRVNERIYTEKENYFVMYFRHEMYISSKLDSDNPMHVDIKISGIFEYDK